MSFGNVLEKFVQHMQGYCFGGTKAAIVIVDDWRAADIDAWRANIDQVRKNAAVEFYMLNGDGTVTMMTV